MKETLEFSNTQAPTVQKPAAAARTAQNQAAAVKAPKQDTPEEVAMVKTAMGVDRPDVTFRRDNNGRIYYVVSDAQSGKEIQELPPQAVRSVAEGIDEYLKQEQAKPHTSLNAKG